MKKLFTLFFLIVFSTTLNAQFLKLFEVVDSGFPVMKAKYYAIDSNGRQLTNLTPAHFTITDGDAPANVISVICGKPVKPQPVSVVITVDVSGSMSGTIDFVKDALHKFAGIFPFSTSELALTSFSDQNSLLCDFTMDKSKFLDAVDQLEAYGGTDFNEAFLEEPAGAYTIANNSRHKKSVIFLTDGMGYGDSARIVKTAIDKNINVNCILIDMASPSILSAVANKSKGQVFEYINSGEQIEGIYMTLLQVVQNQVPCQIHWEAKPGCNLLRNLIVEIPKLNMKYQGYYTAAENTVIHIETKPDAIRYKNIEPGTVADTAVTLTAKNGNVEIKQILCDNELFELHDYELPLFVAKDSTAKIRIKYKPVDEAETMGIVTIKKSRCNDDFIYLGRNCTWKIISPAPGDTTFAGETIDIEWFGTLPKEKIKIDLSTDGGHTYTEVAENITGSDAKITLPVVETDNAIVKAAIQNPQFVHTIYSSKNRTYQRRALKRAVLFDYIFSEDNKYLIFSILNKYRFTTFIFDVDNNKIIKQFPYPKKGKLSRELRAHFHLNFANKDEIYVLQNEKKRIETVDIKTGKTTGKVMRFKEHILSVAMSDSSEFLALAIPEDIETRRNRDAEIKIIDFRTEKTINSFPIDYYPDRLYFIPGNSKVLIRSGVNRALICYDIENGTEIYRIPLGNYYSGINREILLKNKNMLITQYETDSDSLMLIHNLQTGEKLKTLEHCGDIIGYHHALDYLLSFDYYKSQNTLFFTDLQANETFVTSELPYAQIAMSNNGKTFVDFNPFGFISKFYIDYISAIEGRCAAISDEFLIRIPNIEAGDIDFGKVMLSFSRDTIVKGYLKNTGSGNVRINNIAFQTQHGLNPYRIISGFPPFWLNSGQTKDFEFRFSPLLEGNNPAKIFIHTSTDTLIYSFTGTGIKKSFEAIEMVNFGVCKKNQPVDSTITASIINTGDIPLNISDITLYGANPEQFELLDGSQPFTIQAGESKDLTFRFKADKSGVSNCIAGFRLKEFNNEIKIKLLAECPVYRSIILRGKVYNTKTGDSLEAEVVCIDIEYNKERARTSTNLKNNGFYEIKLAGGSIYNIAASKEGYLPTSGTIDLRNEILEKIWYLNLYLSPIEKGVIIKLNNLYFDFDESKLREQSFAELDRLIDIINENENMHIEIGGHTDNKGTTKYNIELSEKRANAVKNYFVNNGINENRLQVVGYGEKVPLRLNNSDANRQMNRRVEIKVTKL